MRVNRSLLTDPPEAARGRPTTAGRRDGEACYETSRLRACALHICRLLQHSSCVRSGSSKHNSRLWYFRVKMNTCLACNGSAGLDEQLRCSACRDCYHYKCYSMPTEYYKENLKKLKLYWKCQTCSRITQRKQDSTPVRGRFSPLSTADITNMSCDDVADEVRCSMGHEHTSNTMETTSSKSQAAITFDQFGLLLDAKLATVSTEIREDINYLKTCLDNLNAKLLTFDQRIKSLERLEDENTVLKATVTNLQLQLESQAQQALSNEVEISGLEESANENLTHLVLITANKLGMELQEVDLNFVSRAGPKIKNTEDKTPSGSNRARHRPLVVSFIRRTKRDEFLKHAKSRKSLSSKDIVGQGVGGTVYVNERLTGSKRHLFRTARTFAKEEGYKYCWLRNGSIFLRKQDAKEGSPALRIQSEEDLNRLTNAGSQADPKKQ